MARHISINLRYPEFAKRIGIEGRVYVQFIIDTDGKEILDEPKIPATLVVRDISDTLYNGSIGIEYRGSTSQIFFDKKSYGMEIWDQDGNDMDVDLAGFPPEEDWILQGPYSDKSLIRNALIYYLSNSIGQYATRTQFFELTLNSDFLGTYLLMEKIKRDNNRIDIEELSPDETEGNDLTGGYILKFDWGWTGENNGGFLSDYDGMLYNYHYPKPDEISSQQENYIQSFINNFESVMNSNNYNSDDGYSQLIDVSSFIDFIILQEISRNVDAYGLSTYIYKDKESINNKLIAGPIWDFNHGFGNCDYFKAWQTEGWNIGYIYDDMDQRAFWWLKLWNDESFISMVKDRYKDLRGSVLSTNNINSKIDEYVSTLGNSVDKNFTKWPILGEYIWPNYEVFESHEEEIKYLKLWINNRLNWMDSELN